MKGAKPGGDGKRQALWERPLRPRQRFGKPSGQREAARGRDAAMLGAGTGRGVRASSPENRAGEPRPSSKQRGTWGGRLGPVCAASPAPSTPRSWKHRRHLEGGRAGLTVQENPEEPKGEPSALAQLL